MWGTKGAATTMLQTATNHDRTLPGRQIAARRAYLQKSQGDIDKETGGVVYVRLLSRLELGEKPLGTLKISQYRELLRALDWTPEDFELATGISAPAGSPAYRRYEPDHAIPYFGAATPGAKRLLRPSQIGNAVREATYLIDPNLPGLKDHNPQHFVVLRADATSMITDAAAGRIPADALLVCERLVTPRLGNLVVGWIDELGIALLKQHGDDPHALVRSRTEEGPVGRMSSYPHDVCAVVRQVILEV